MINNFKTNSVTDKSEPIKKCELDIEVKGKRKRDFDGVKRKNASTNKKLAKMLKDDYARKFIGLG